MYASADSKEVDWRRKGHSARPSFEYTTINSSVTAGFTMDGIRIWDVMPRTCDDR